MDWPIYWAARWEFFWEGEGWYLRRVLVRKRSKSRRDPTPGRAPTRRVGEPKNRGTAWWLRAAHVSVALIVLVMPLIVLQRHLDAFALPKLMVAEFLGLVSVVFLAVGAALGEWRRRLVDPKVLVWILVPPSIWITLGLSWTLHPLHTRTAWVDWAIAATCLAAWSLSFSTQRLRRLFELVRWPGLVLAVVGILQFHDLYQPFHFDAGADTARLRVTSLAGAAGDLAAFLAIACLVWQSRWIDLRKAGRGSWPVWGCAVGALLCAYGLSVTQTLTAGAALLVGSVILWSRMLPRRRRWQVGLGVPLAVLLALLLVTPLRERVWSKVERAEEVGLNFVLSGRLDAWRVAVRMAAEHPLGIGHGAFRAEYVPTKLKLSTEGEAFYRGHLYPTFSQAHNEFLQVAAEWGWLGVGLVLLALLALLRRLISRRIAGEDEGLVWSQLAAFFVLSVAHFPWHLALTAYPGLLLLAVALSSEAEDTP